MERLNILTDHDDKMLHALLAMTLQSNAADLQQAEQLFSQSAWSELGKCVHRMSGAAQITGAQRAEQACRQLEKSCLNPPADITLLATQWTEVRHAVAELNASISGFLHTP
jgi:two-component system sensor histidine kinase EvgS